MPGRRPDALPLQQMLVDQRREWRRMRQRRHSADGKAGVRADEVRIRLAERLADEGGDARFVDAVGSAGDDEQGSAARHQTEHE